MDSSAYKLDSSDFGQIKQEIENNRRSYSTVNELIADFELVNKLGIEINFANRLITTSQGVLGYFKLETGFKSNDFQGILEALLKIPEDLKDEKIQDLLKEITVKQESVVLDKETLKELKRKQVEAEVKRGESSVQRETVDKNIKTFVEKQKEIVKVQRDLNTEKATKTNQAEIVQRANVRTEETVKPKLEVVQGKVKSGIERLVEQNTKSAETKIQGLGVTAKQASVVVEKTFRQFGPRILEQKPIIFPKKEIAEITKEITNPVVRKKVTTRLAEVVNGLDVKEKFERKSKSVAEDWITKIQDNENISDYTKDRLIFSRPKIEQAVMNSLSGRDLETGEIYTNTFSNEVIRILPELTATELSTVKVEARGVEEEISSLIKGNPGLINTYRGEVFEEVFDNKIIESNPNLTEEQRLVANDLKDFIKPFVNNPIDSFSKEIMVKAGVGGENSAKMERDFEYTKMTVGLVTGQEKVENVIKRFELLNQRAVDVNLHIDGLADVDRLQSFFGEIKTGNLTGYFNRAQGWTNFIQKADKFTGGFVTRIFPKLGNFLNNGIGGGFRVFAQNTFGLISKNGLGQGLKMAMGNFLGNGLKLGASAAGKALAGGAVQAAVGTAVGVVTGGIGAAIMGGLSFLKDFLKGNLGDALGNLGKAGIGIAATLLGPALAGALASATAAATAAAGPIIIGVFGFLFIYMIFTSNQISSLVPPVGMGGGDAQVIPALDPNRVIPPGCPQIMWPIREKAVISQGPLSSFSHGSAQAVDIASTSDSNVTGVEIHTTHNGVAQSGYDPGGYGYYVRVTGKCEEKTFSTIYGHMPYKPDFDTKDVMVNEVIGRVDNTGNSHGSHLHYELVDLSSINDYLPQRIPEGCGNTENSTCSIIINN